MRFTPPMIKTLIGITMVLWISSSNATGVTGSSALTQACKSLLEAAGRLPVHYSLASSQVKKVFIAIDTNGGGFGPNTFVAPIEIAMIILDEKNEVISAFSRLVAQDSRDITAEHFSPEAWTRFVANKVVAQLKDHSNKGAQQSSDEVESLEAIERQLVALMSDYGVSRKQNSKLFWVGDDIAVPQKLRPFRRNALDNIPETLQFFSGRINVADSHEFMETLGLRIPAREKPPRAIDRVVDAVRRFRTMARLMEFTMADGSLQFTGRVPRGMDDTYFNKLVTQHFYGGESNAGSETPDAYHARTEPKDENMREARAAVRQRFLDALPQPEGNSKRRILDAGMGTGRDTLFFAENGFEVTGYDGSQGFVDFAAGELASANLAADLRRLDFADIMHGALEKRFHGFFASASFIHAGSLEHLEALIGAHLNLLVPGGVGYMSFLSPKEGEKSGVVDASLVGPTWNRGRSWIFFTRQDLERFLRDAFPMIEIVSVSDPQGDSLNRHFSGLGGVQWTEAIVRMKRSSF